MFELSSEQQLFIEKALEGKNILVDACIGSGKTTAIQHLCDALPSNKRILYLTYNKLLKLDAKSKIKNRNVTVTNYHGFAYMCLAKANISAGISDLIQIFNRKRPATGFYDVLIIDEYQDIEQELAELLLIIKGTNPGMQIVAVGDMEQKIYDKTTLDVRKFIDSFLGDRLTLEFTQCFRLSQSHASMLGRIWNKNIAGVNPSCSVEYMSKNKAVNFLKDQNPQDILCLGARHGDLSDTLNILEYRYPEKYNKNTIYASIRDNDNGSGKVEPKANNGIFTTFDSSKGLERKICVIFDFTEDYWAMRISKPQIKYDILRNIFCVAASRGKEKIIFVKGQTPLLTEKTLSTPVYDFHRFENMNISEMFDFKYKEDIEECYSYLECKKIPVNDHTEIDIKTNDGLIDLSPCIGIYQEASYFDGYDLEDELNLMYDTDKDKSDVYMREFYTRGMQGQILVLTAMQTHQNRYMNQVSPPFIEKESEIPIHARLAGEFSKKENVQVGCSKEYRYKDEKGNSQVFEIKGFADVVKENKVYELKFVSELTHEHFLQCATYMFCLGLENGILWNVRTNTKYSIKIKDRKKFEEAVIKTITKHYLQPEKSKPKKRKK